MQFAELKVTLIGWLPRGFAVWLGLRKLSPRDRKPTRANQSNVPVIDTGASFRPDWRKQNPSSDPKEPYGSESGSAGEEHGWGNCTMVSAALAYAYHVKDKSGPHGGDMRHNQSDLSGGTDLYDARTAWDNFGNQSLTIKSGQGWSAVKAAHNEKRAIIIQGEGNVPGTESFDGGHACIIGIETNSEGKWLWGDPLASGWQWVSPGSIEDWAKRLSSGVLFAVSKVVENPPPEPPEEPDKPPAYVFPPDPGYGEGYAKGRLDGSNTALDMVFASWMQSSVRGGYWDRSDWNKATWSQLPIPIAEVARASKPAVWDGHNWTGAIWLN